MLKWVRAALAPTGLHVETALDAMTGLSVARKSRPDVIILDLGLPAGGGVGFLQRLRWLPSGSVPVIILSGTLTANSPVELAAYDVSEFLKKPVEPARLVEAVRRALAPATDFPAAPGNPE